MAVAWYLKWKRIPLQLKQKRKEVDALEFNRKDAYESHVSLEMEKVKKATSQTLST